MLKHSSRSTVRWFVRMQPIWFGSIVIVSLYSAVRLLPILATLQASSIDKVNTEPSASIISTTPLTNATNISVTTPVKVVFAQTMNPSTINETTFHVRDSTGLITASVSYTDRTAILIPNQYLKPFSTYTVTLNGQIQDLTGNFLPIYTWTFATAFDSNLPLVIVDTFGTTIKDDPKIPAHMQIIWNKNGERNFLNGGSLHADQHIGIEIRGNTSQGYLKHQYGVEIWDTNDKDIDASLLDLPAESDWIIQGPYIDRTLMRNFLAYQLSNQIGRYAARTRFVELFLNDTNSPNLGPGQYLGIYLLLEKIKRNENRVAIAKLTPDQNSEPDISGGYIVKLDALDPGELFFRTAFGNHQIIYVYPKNNTITAAQQAWIRNYFNQLEAILVSDDFTDWETGYDQMIDVDSFIDHLLLNEFLRNMDELRVSAYLYKERRGKLSAGPVWDFDLAGGYIDLADGANPKGWHVQRPSGGNYPIPFWWKRLLQDNCFTLRLKQRWIELRQGTWSTPAINALLDQTAALLDEAQIRNFQRWPLLGRKIYIERFVGRTYVENVAYLRDWLGQRGDWIDHNVQTISTRTSPQQAGLCFLPVHNVAVTSSPPPTTFQIALASKPAMTVTIGLNTSNPIVTLSTPMLHFTSLTWDKPQIVVISVTNPAISTPITSTIFLEPSPSADKNYALLKAHRLNFKVDLARQTIQLEPPHIDRPRYTQVYLPQISR